EIDSHGTAPSWRWVGRLRGALSLARIVSDAPWRRERQFLPALESKRTRAGVTWAPAPAGGRPGDSVRGARGTFRYHRPVDRTFAFGDIPGDLDALERVFGRLPPLERGDTLIFVGDYVDRGPKSAQVIETVRRLARDGPAAVVALRGNHEDAWL